jgi:hypothetical protein
MTDRQSPEQLLRHAGGERDAAAVLRLLEPADLDAALALIPPTVASRARAEKAVREAWSNYHHLRGRSWE